MAGVKSNGAQTIIENIADLGGMVISFQAFTNKLKKDGYTGEQPKLQQQRFFRVIAESYRSKYSPAYVNFIAFGIGNSDDPDTHSMNKERLNGTVANTDGWYEAFDIKDGALYRAPADRVRIW